MSASNLNVIWLVHGNNNTASARLQAYNVHRELLRRDINTRLLLAPPFHVKDIYWDDADIEQLARLARGSVVIIHKLNGPKIERLIKLVKEAGGKTAYVHCDYDPNNQIPLYCDAVICPSHKLVSYYRDKGAKRVEHIPDPVEFFCNPRNTPRNNDRRGLTICWVGHKSNWPTLDPIHCIMDEPEFGDFRLLTISSHADASIPWSLRNVERVVPTCDLAVIPTMAGKNHEVKSSNRVALFMAAGVPVIAGRLESYEEVINHGWNGFLATTQDEYRNALRMLRDPEVRGSIRNVAYDFATQEFSIESIVNRWVTVLGDLVSNSASLVDPASYDSSVKQLVAKSNIRMAADASIRYRRATAWTLLAWSVWPALRWSTVRREFTQILRFLMRRERRTVATKLCALPSALRAAPPGEPSGKDHGRFG